MVIEVGAVNLFLLVVVRLSGMLWRNPLLGRQNFPARARMGLIFFMTVLLVPGLDPAPVSSLGGFELGIVMVKELAIGALLGYVFQVFYYLLFFVGDYLDTAFGMSMAKVFDPGTQIQMSLSGNLLSITFILYFLLTDGHLVLLHLFAHSFKMLPLGGMLFSQDLAKEMVTLFSDAFLLVIRLLLPFAVTEFTLEVSMGILMKVIPQIHIFVINFQLKMMLGFLMLFMFLPYVNAFIDNYIATMLDTLQGALIMAGGTL